MDLLLVCLIFVLTLFNSAALAILAIAKHKKDGIVNPTSELADFMGDLKRHGYSVARVDPDTVLRRSPHR